MAHFVKMVLWGGLVAASATAAQASAIERACLKAGRAAASAPLCNCIQQVADITLDAQDQRLAASFFADPHSAQVIRQSDQSSHEAFWKRYKGFSASAQSYCRSF